MSEINYSTAANLGKAHPVFPYYFNSGANGGTGAWQPYAAKTADDPSYWVYNNYTTGTISVVNNGGLKSSVLDLDVFAPLSGGVEKAIISYVGNSASSATLDAILTFATTPASGTSPARDGYRLGFGTLTELSPTEYNNMSLMMEPASAASGVSGYFSFSYYKKS